MEQPPPRNQQSSSSKVRDATSLITTQATTQSVSSPEQYRVKTSEINYENIRKVRPSSSLTQHHNADMRVSTNDINEIQTEVNVTTLSTKPGKQKEVTALREGESGQMPTISSDITDISDSDDTPTDELDSDALPGHYINTNVLRTHVGSWRLPIRIGDYKTEAPIDSGAHITLIRDDIVSRLSREYRKIRPTTTWYTSVNGDQKKAIGELRAPVQVSTKRIWVDFVVVDMKDPILLGMNFVFETKAIIDFGGGTLQIGRETIFLEMEGRPKTARMTVRRSTVIPARSETIIEIVPISKRHRHNGTVAIQPLPTFPENTGLVMGHTLTDCRRNTIKVPVVNPNDHDTTLTRGDPVALANPVDSVIGAIDRHVSCVDDDECNVDAHERLPDYLREMIDRTNLKPKQKHKCAALIDEFKDCFAEPDGPLGRTNVIQHKIYTGDNPPVKQKQRRFPQKQQEIIAEELEKMFKLNAIEPSTSPWSSQVVLVRKKNGQIRFCVDYRGLNDVTRKDSYPLPNIQDTYDSLAGAQYFSTLDLASGYWQVELAPEDRPKTAFATRQGLFQFKVMAFGLSNAPATFERLMETVLKGLLWDRCMCYLDDVIVYGQTFDSALENLRHVMYRLRQSGLKLQAKKCDLFKKEILYLGFIISGKGVRVDPKKVEVIRKWPRPCTVTDVRSFLGFGNYHRRFVQDYAAISEPLVALTRGNTPFHWGRAQQRSFDTLKRKLMSAPQLAHPTKDEQCMFILDTDASAYAVGGALSQRVDGKEYPIAFASKTLSRTQRNYCTTYRELLAVVEMIQHYQ